MMIDGIGVLTRNTYFLSVASGMQGGLYEVSNLQCRVSPELMPSFFSSRFILLPTLFVFYFSSFPDLRIVINKKRGTKQHLSRFIPHIRDRTHMRENKFLNRTRFLPSHIQRKRHL